MIRVCSVIAMAMLLLTAAARAQQYPAKPIRIIVPVQPGGGLDPQARLLGRQFQERMGQSVVVEMFKQRAGFDATHIPYKGSGPATVALMSGEVDFSFAGAISMIPHLRSGKVKALAVTSPAPSRLAPQLPTMASLFPGFESVNWYAIFAPAATPAATLNKLGSEIVAAVRSPAMRDFMHKEGADAVGSTPQVFAAFFQAEVERYAKVIRAAAIRVD